MHSLSQDLIDTGYQEAKAESVVFDFTAENMPYIKNVIVLEVRCTQYLYKFLALSTRFLVFLFWEFRLGSRIPSFLFF